MGEDGGFGKGVIEVQKCCSCFRSTNECSGCGGQSVQGWGDAPVVSQEAQLEVGESKGMLQLFAELRLGPFLVDGNFSRVQSDSSRGDSAAKEGDGLYMEFTFLGLGEQLVL